MNIPEEQTVLSAVEQIGAGKEFDVSTYKTIGVVIIGHNDAGSDAADGIVKCQGSFEWRTGVDFTSAAGVTNPWGFIALGDQNNASIDIDGVNFLGNEVKLFKVNTGSIRTLNFKVTSYTNGAFTVKIYPIDKR